MPLKPYLDCGMIINTHGCRGGVKLESHCNSPEVLAKMKRIFFLQGENYTEKRVFHALVLGRFVVAELDGISDMDAAAALKNTVVYAAREDFHLSEGEYFLADVIGLDVVDAENGKLYGKITGTEAGALYEMYKVATPDGERLLPAISRFVERIDYERAVYVNTIQGLLD